MRTARTRSGSPVSGGTKLLGNEPLTVAVQFGEPMHAGRTGSIAKVFAEFAAPFTKRLSIVSAADFGRHVRLPRLPGAPPGTIVKSTRSSLTKIGLTLN